MTNFPMLSTKKMAWRMGAAFAVITVAVVAGPYGAEASPSALARLIRLPHIEYVIAETAAGRRAFDAIAPRRIRGTVESPDGIRQLRESLRMGKVRDLEAAEQLSNRLAVIDREYKTIKRQMGAEVDVQKLLRVLTLEHLEPYMASHRGWFGSEKVRFVSAWEAGGRNLGLVRRFIEGDWAARSAGPTLRERFQALNETVPRIRNLYRSYVSNPNDSITRESFLHRLNQHVELFIQAHRAARWEYLLTSESRALDAADAHRKTLAEFLDRLRTEFSGTKHERLIDGLVGAIGIR